MIKLVVRVDNLEHLETLIGVAKTLDLQVDLGVEAPQLPSKRRAAPSTKKARKGKKRRSGRMAVKVGKGVEGGPQLKAAYAAILEHFDKKTFEKREATNYLKTRLRLKNRPTATVGLLLDRGGLIPA